MNTTMLGNESNVGRQVRWRQHLLQYPRYACRRDSGLLLYRRIQSDATSSAVESEK